MLKQMGTLMTSKLYIYIYIYIKELSFDSIIKRDKMDQAILDVLRPSLPNEDDTHFTLPAQNNDTLYETCDDDVSDRVLSKIERYLMRGDRAGAVNYAMQEDLWAHALIISSCVGKDLWQQVISSFVDREMNATAEMRRNRTFHNIAGSNQPLRVLYCLFSGVGSAASKFIPCL